LVVDNADFGFPPLRESGVVPPDQCNDWVDSDADALIDLTDPCCSDVSDNNERDDLSQGIITELESGSLELFTLLLR